MLISLPLHNHTTEEEEEESDEDMGFDLFGDVEPYQAKKVDWPKGQKVVQTKAKKEG